MTTKTKFPLADVIRPHENSLPDGIKNTAKFYWLDNDGVKLRVMLAHPKQSEPRGSLILHPGRTEFIEKYLETVENFLERGFTVLVIDPRGQGLSDRLLEDRTKSYVAHFQDYANDLAFAISEFGTSLPKPHILVGHSMGGCVVLQSIISGVTNPSAVICSAPMLGLFDIDTIITRFIIRCCDWMGMSKKNLPFQGQKVGHTPTFKGNKLTSDPTRFKRWAEYFKTSPALRLGPPTIGWVSQAIKAMAYVNRNAANVKIPGLIIAAGGDPIVDPATNRRFCELSGLDFHVVRGAMHELFMERDEYREKFLSEIDAFLDRNAL